jgi:predicted DNA-binding transcriptional regulator AlpA
MILAAYSSPLTVIVTTTSGTAKGRTLLTGNANVPRAPVAQPFHPAQARTLPQHHEVPSGRESEDTRQGGRHTDELISISNIRTLFKLGRTAAYELTRRPEFPAPVQVSSRCLRWWAGEVNAYAASLQREGAQRRARRTPTRQANSATPPRRITGTVRPAHGRKEPS